MSDFPTNPLSGEIAVRNALYAMMASNCYHENEKLYFPIEKLGWELVDKDGDPTDKPTKENGPFTGFAYDLYVHSKSNKTVLAMRGSDSKKDWVLSNAAVLVSIPYKSARKAVRKYLQKFPERSLTLVGHSLGGGLALGASCHHGVPAFTFNPSPRIFDGLGDYHEEAVRVCIYQEGEALQKARQYWQKKFVSVVKANDIYMTNFTFGAQHDSDLLAEGIRSFALTAAPELARAAGLHEVAGYKK